MAIPRKYSLLLSLGILALSPDAHAIRNRLGRPLAAPKPPAAPPVVIDTLTAIEPRDTPPPSEPEPEPQWELDLEGSLSGPCCAAGTSLSASYSKKLGERLGFQVGAGLGFDDLVSKSPLAGSLDATLSFAHGDSAEFALHVAGNRSLASAPEWSIPLSLETRLVQGGNKAWWRDELQMSLSGETSSGGLAVGFSARYGKTRDVDFGFGTFALALEGRATQEGKRSWSVGFESSVTLSGTWALTFAPSLEQTVLPATQGDEATTENVPTFAATLIATF